MAGLKTRLPGKTLVEVIVAMLIIVFMSAISSTVYVRVLGKTSNEKDIRLHQLAEDIAYTAVMEKRFFSEQIERDNLKVTKSFKAYKGLEDIVEMNIEITDGEDRHVLARTELIKIKK
jgi:hypothetical protein